MKQVQVFKWVKEEGATHYDKVFDEIGHFAQYGVDYEEFESGAGNFSTAIVEMHDGRVRNVPVEMIKFV